MQAQKDNHGLSSGPGVAVPPPVLLLIVLIPVGLHVAVGGRLLSEGWVPFALGIPFTVAGFGIFVWGGRTMQEAETSPHPGREDTRLVTDGPFRFSRNPMTVGTFLTLLGIALVFNGIWLLLMSLLYGVFGAVQVIREERHLEQRFGEPYLDYRRQVRRWI